MIDPRALVHEGLLQASDLSDPPPNSEAVDFEAVRSWKAKVLDQAFEIFRRQSSATLANEFEQFTSHAAGWLDDYALFEALKSAQGDREWTAWDHDLAFREPGSLQKARQELAWQISREQFCQFLFFRQWTTLRREAAAHSIRVIGDVPIFVAHDSADVWAHRELFKLDEHGKPTVVAGVPPDYFSVTGQLWGNPLYDWDAMRADDFRWWIDRLRWSLELFDLVRIDHFRGFVASWEIPAADVTAQNGRWVETPGRQLFSTLQKTLGDLPIIAENLGVITPEVESLRADFGFPGMRVLQFAFGGDATNDHLPHRHTRDSVVYTGTHDNDTTIGWFASAAETERDYSLKYLASDGREINWDLIRAAMASVADVAIVPIQDGLGLGNEARMNLPASTEGDWSWRMKTSALNDELARRLKQIGQLYGRNLDG